LVLQLQKSKVSTMVHAPLFFGHRSLLQWARLRQSMTIDGDGELWWLLQLNKMLRRRGFSPGCFQGARRRTSGTETTTTSPIPVSRCKEERWKSSDWGWTSSIPRSMDAQSIMAELRGFSLWLGKAYSGEDKVHRS
jgi:hypothetical protein